MSELREKLVHAIRSAVYESETVADHMHEAATLRAVNGVLGWLRPEIIRLIRTATVNMPPELAEEIVNRDAALSAANSYPD